MNLKSYEAIVVGSGATGGVAALTLAKAGVRVLVVEAGPELSVKRALGSEPANTFRRISGIINGTHTRQSQHPGFWKANPLLYANEKIHPYSFPKEKPFLWTQGNQVGGRSLTWGGITLRLSNNEFKAADRDGFGPNWPIDYLDLAPHYTALEKLFRVRGNKDYLNELPDGEYIKALPFTNSEEYFSRQVRNNLGYPLIHSRGFAHHEPQSDSSWPSSSSVGSTLKKALATGRVELLTDHMAENISMNPDRDLAKGLVVVNQRNGSRQELQAGLIVLCASTIQTLRILLNSEEKNSTNGFVDPSGNLGCFLMDHVSTCKFFALSNKYIRQRQSEKSNHVLSGAGSFFIPFGSNLKIVDDEDPTFIRGYGLWGAIDRFDPPKCLKRITDSSIGFLIGHGEVLPVKQNKVSLSKERDKWDMYIPHIECAWGANEKQMVLHMKRAIQNAVEASGGEVLPLHDLVKMPFVEPLIRNSYPLQDEAPPPGYYIHEVGGAPMGLTENQSVLTPWNRLWRCRNVLVTDGACWPTSGWQSPTLTMMAITRRACINAIRN